jgi:hypothetical protein
MSESALTLVPNLLGMWVYMDARCPRFDPPKLVGEAGRWYINPADVDAFHRWAGVKAMPGFRYQVPIEPSLWGAL